MTRTCYQVSSSSWCFTIPCRVTCMIIIVLICPTTFGGTQFFWFSGYTNIIQVDDLPLSSAETCPLLALNPAAVRLRGIVMYDSIAESVRLTSRRIATFRRRQRSPYFVSNLNLHVILNNAATHGSRGVSSNVVSRSLCVSAFSLTQS